MNITLIKDIGEIILFFTQLVVSLIGAVLLFWGKTQLEDMRNEKKMNAALYYRLIILYIDDLISELTNNPELKDYWRKNYADNFQKEENKKIENLDVIYREIKALLQNKDMMPYSKDVQTDFAKLYKTLNDWYNSYSTIDKDFENFLECLKKKMFKAMDEIMKFSKKADLKTSCQ
jgi:hypothetical protein